MNKQDKLSSLISDYIAKLVVGYAKMNELSASQLYILKLLGTKGDKNCSEIADLLDITLSAVTNLVNKLVKKGYVRRIVPEYNRRVIMLQITEDGKDMLYKSDTKYNQLTKDLLEDLSEDEIDILIQAYEKINSKL